MSRQVASREQRVGMIRDHRQSMGAPVVDALGDFDPRASGGLWTLSLGETGAIAGFYGVERRTRSEDDEQRTITSWRTGNNWSARAGLLTPVDQQTSTVECD